MKKEQMDIVFLLDRSGSMSGCESDTIGGYNSYLKNEKNKNALVTTVLFDDQYKLLTERVKLSEIKELTNKDYFVRGSTALLDAIGKTINYLDRKKANKVMFIITTDGYENASREYTKSKIKSMIEKHSNWEFMYIGADIDSYAEGASLGIKYDNISNYRKDKAGVSKLFNSISKASDMYCCDTLNASWKEELEDYINDNKVC